MDRTSGVKDIDLPSALKFDGPANCLKRVDILHLRPCSELTGAFRTHRQVDVGAHGTFLHLAVGDVHIDQHLSELFQIIYHLVGAPEIRFGNDFHQRNAAAVIIDQRARCIVNQLACVFLHVDFMKTDALLSRSDRLQTGSCLYSAVYAVVFISAGVADHAVFVQILIRSSLVDLHIAVETDRMIKLGNLVIFRKVRVEIVFSVEDVRILQIAVKSETCLDGTVYDALVEHRQRTGHSHTDRTGMRVRLTSEFRRAAAENLCFRGELYVDLQAHDDFIFHYSAPPFPKISGLLM